MDRNCSFIKERESKRSKEGINQGLRMARIKGRKGTEIP